MNVKADNNALFIYNWKLKTNISYSFKLLLLKIPASRINKNTIYNVFLKINIQQLCWKKTEELNSHFMYNICESLYIYETDKQKHTHRI